MNPKQLFLTLSLKEQICIIIIGLNLFCILVILLICSSLAYEILKQDFEQKKLYFYDRYKDYIESCFYFQNFCLLQYEEIIHRMQQQMREHFQVYSIYNFSKNIRIFDYNKLVNIKSSLNESKLMEEYNSLNNVDNLYCFLFKGINPSILFRLSSQYDTFSSLIASHDINDSLIIPMFESISVMETPLFLDFSQNTFYSFNPLKIYKKIKEIGNEINSFILMEYYNNLINEIYPELTKIIKQILIDTPSFIPHIFNKAINNIKEKNPDYIDYLDEDMELYMLLSGYLPKIDFSNNKLILINRVNYYTTFIYIETNLIDNYLYFTNSRLSNNKDIYFIPLFYENNTIISPDLCFLFLLKQFEYQIDINKANELFNKIIKGKSKIDKCFINENALDNQLEIKDILNLNLSYFLNLSYSNINQGIINLQNLSYYFIKYTYPNYNSLIEFKSDYFFQSQINYYLFSSFREPIKYTNLYHQILLNCFYLILLLIIYIWLLCLFINLLISNRIISQLKEPLKNLKKAIKSNSIKDENIFKYEYDDSINELFLTCKEILTGQIDKNDNGKLLGNFNILSLNKNNNRNNSQNIYVNNLIINHQIMNKLINQQKTLFDFSKNIKINDYNKEQKNINKIENNDKSYNNNFDDNLNNINNSKNNNNIKNYDEEKENQNKKIYIELFQISEFIYEFENKNQQNYIHIKNNIINDESTKIDEIDNEKKTNLQKSIKNTDKNLLNKNKKSITINMTNNKNISYLWYMEAKQNNNKSLNYKLGNNYEELFMDCIK